MLEERVGRFGAGGQIMASKPSKTLISRSERERASADRVPLAPARKEVPLTISAGRPSVGRSNPSSTGATGKENPRSISACRPSVARNSAAASARKENPRPISAGRASIARPENSAPKLAEKTDASANVAVRRSTSSLPRGKPADFHGDRLPRGSTSVERRSFSGLMVLDKGPLVGKGQLGKASTGNRGESTNMLANVNVGRSNGYLGTEPVKSSCKILVTNRNIIGSEVLKGEAGHYDSQSCRGDLNHNLELPIRKGTKEFSISENHEDGIILIETKQAKENGHGNGSLASFTNEKKHASGFLNIDMKAIDGPKEKGNSVLVSKSICETTGDFVRDKGMDLGEKGCFNLIPEGFERSLIAIDNDHYDCTNSLDEAHHIAGAVRAAPDSVKAAGNLVEDVMDACQGIKYQSKLHQKLAILEGRVQKIAMEIKQTKEMLDTQKLGEFRLVLSDIQKRICGFEKAVDSMKDGAISDLVSDDVKVGILQDERVDSCVIKQTFDSSISIKSLNGEELVARFLPHQMLTRDHMSSVASRGQDNSCKQTVSQVSDDTEMDDSLVDENPIEQEFLASLDQKLPNIKNINASTQLSHGVLSKMQFGSTSSSGVSGSMIGGQEKEIELETNEKLEEFDVLGSNPPVIASNDSEEFSTDQLFEIGKKVSTGGWFVSDGDAVLLAHYDNSCSYYDITNSEVKSEYKPPADCSSNLWGDCWLIRAPGIDGCSGRYIVAASAGNASESGFCSWDFYTKDINAFRIVGEKKSSLASSSYRSECPAIAGNALQAPSTFGNHFCWFKPCGPLLICTSSKQKIVNAYDIRDGDLVMTWKVKSPVSEMDYSSPLQWRSKCKTVIAEREAITLWDVNSLNPQPLLSVPYAEKKIYSLHVNNTDAEIGAGVRQSVRMSGSSVFRLCLEKVASLYDHPNKKFVHIRASSSEVEGNDGVFCTQDSINVLDFRNPSGTGLKISRHGANPLSLFSRGDSILIGSTEGRLQVKGGLRAYVEHYSLRKGRIVTTYEMPDFNSHYHHSSITQVWGNLNLAMGICGMGLFVFDAFKDEGLQSSSIHQASTTPVREIVGSDDLYRPTFDYLGSRVLIISRDRPASWKYLL
ncbi:hypothetical protein AXF42_Ash011374 [Apostasia shenzhenica]|uniref:At4g14310 8-bladed propeller domain-containing protein n=1 Tax=Apostasia shenzhenica TaxID=1088818 RepID=A0A2I0AEB3_9ASPA|nr:hypothetical protein AXF42_Ash011374 [Apostasia shenzhenica]